VIRAAVGLLRFTVVVVSSTGVDTTSVAKIRKLNWRGGFTEDRTQASWELGELRDEAHLNSVSSFLYATASFSPAICNFTGSEFRHGTD